APRRTRTALLAVLGSVLAVTAVAAPHPAAADTTAAKLAVQVSGVFADDTSGTARAATTSIVVGTVATTNLAFVAGTADPTPQSFEFTTVCADSDGTACASG